jgi:hypothetical protein
MGTYNKDSYYKSDEVITVQKYTIIYKKNYIRRKIHYKVSTIVGHW